jgi:hypothetical protein
MWVRRYLSPLDRPSGPVVDDLDATRDAMMAAGIDFIGEPQLDGGVAWNHDRGSDGNVGEIIGNDQGAA